jgi:hypothetical protein
VAYPDLADLRYRVRDLLNESGTSFITDAMLNRWLNDGERDVAIKSLCYEREYAITTTANTRSVSVTCVKTLGVEYIPSTGSRVGLGKITPRMVGHLELTGTTPQYWFPWGDKICIEPIPQTTYNLAYVAILPTAEMSADTDEPEIPESFIPWIIQYAYIRGLIRDKKYATAAKAYKRYMEEMQYARNNIIKKYADVRHDFEIPNSVEGVAKNG